MSQTILLIALFLCHWFADYTHLSTEWMLNAKRFGKPLFPIFIHACVHGLLMGLVLSVYGGLNYVLPQVIFSLIGFQVFTHFLIDVLKGKMNVWFPSVQSPSNKSHWYIFGFDQFLHAVVIILMVKFIHQ